MTSFGMFFTRLFVNTNYPFYCEHKRLSEENSCIRHQNMSSPLDGPDGSKAFDKKLKHVSAKIGKAKN